MTDASASINTTEGEVSLREFLEKVPPGVRTPVSGVKRKTTAVGAPYLAITFPTIELFCTSEECNGPRFFQPTSEEWTLSPERVSEKFVLYYCKNCEKCTKTYALRAILSKSERQSEFTKFGEIPAFGSPTPAKLISLIGPDKDFFLKGRRAENQGLGIAAFAYYRRVVENQKSRIIEEIIRVSKKVNAPPDLISDLEASLTETQFSAAIESIKHGIPDVLRIDGHNPLTLLHSALSQGLHAQSDEECLEVASSIRLVLTELAENLARALKEEAELNAAVSKLLQSSVQKQPKP